MLLQRGNFNIQDISDIETVELNNRGIRNVIDLAYMGKIEFEGNAVPISRMIIEYYKENYEFYPINIYNQKNEQMYFYANSSIIKDKPEGFLGTLANDIINVNFTLYEYINYTDKERLNDFWWSLEGDYFIFFGENKKEIINYFIDICYEKDGGKEEIKNKLLKLDYKVK